MNQDLSASDAGPVRPEHAEHRASEEGSQHDRVVSIIEALLLATVAVLAAWSGSSSARWSTESRLDLAQAATARTDASRANLDATTTKNFDASTFDAWFTAYVAGNDRAMALAERRLRPDFKVAFDAWMATIPASNPQAPAGPTGMPDYRQPDQAVATGLDAKADNLSAEGVTAGGNADDYVRTTIYLATVPFLVSISGHFRFNRRGSVW